MNDPQPAGETPDPERDRLGYFLVRVRRPAAGSSEFGGLVERLGTGEKRVFQTPDELVRVVDEWSR